MLDLDIGPQAEAPQSAYQAVRNPLARPINPVQRQRWFEEGVRLDEEGVLPRPSEHPLLYGGDAYDAARDALEAAFDPPEVLDALGERLRGLSSVQHGSRKLYFILAGSLRVVLEAGESALWGARGRDPRVIDLLGPSCFAGLAEAWAWLHGRVPHGLDELGEGVRRDGYANPVLDPQHQRPQPLVMRGIRYDRLRQLYDAHAPVREWLDQLHELTVVRRDELRALLEGEPVLQGMGRADQNSVLHSAAWAQVRYVFDHLQPIGKPVDVSAPLQRAGDPASAIVMVLQGQVELKSRGDVVGLMTAGDLVLGGLLAREGHDSEAPYPIDSHAGQGTELLVWDRTQLRRILHRSAAGWARLLQYADAASVYAGKGLARLTIVVAEDDSQDSGVVAHGLARVLEDAEPGVGVRLIDLGGAQAVAQAAGRPAVLRRDPPSRQPSAIAVQSQAPSFQELQVEAWTPLRTLLRVVVPDRLEDVVDLVEAARSQAGVSDVVLHIPKPAELAPHLVLCDEIVFLRNDPEALRRRLHLRPCDPRLVLLDALRGIPNRVVWLNTRPDGWWTLTDEAPDRLIRVDRQTSEFLRAAQQRTQAFSRWEHEGSTELDDRPGNAPDHHVHMADDHQVMARAAAGELDALVSDPGNALGATCTRLARMVRGCSVGLALGGGGTWGAAHIGLIQQLEDAGLPVDYIAGTSFGSVVGAVYAGAGAEGLTRFMDRCSVRGRLAPLRLLGQALRGLGSARKRDVDHQDWGTGRRIEMVEASWAGMVGDVRRTGLLVEQVIQDRDRLEGPLPLLATQVPFFAAASNLTSQQTYVPHWLPVGLAVRAASGLAPSFPALRVAGARMADGAALENVPAQILRDHGADYVIAVNVVGAPRARRDDQQRQGGRWPSATPVRERIEETTTTLWLTIWKAGNDQARIAADAVVDLQVSGVQLPATWQTEAVVKEAKQVLSSLEVGPKLYLHWQHGGRDTQGQLRIEGRVDVPTQSP